LAECDISQGHPSSLVILRATRSSPIIAASQNNVLTNLMFRWADIDNGGGMTPNDFR
jgi:hypothetical protein